MAGIAATVLERSDEGTLDPVRFFTGKPFLAVQNAQPIPVQPEVLPPII